MTNTKTSISETASRLSNSLVLLLPFACALFLCICEHAHTSSERLLVLARSSRELFSLSFSEAVHGCASIGLIRLVWEKSRTKRNRRAKVLPPEPSWGWFSFVSFLSRLSQVGSLRHRGAFGVTVRRKGGLLFLAKSFPFFPGVFDPTPRE